MTQSFDTEKHLLIRESDVYLNVYLVIAEE